MTIMVDDEDFLDLLMNQLKGWTTDETALELYKEMYEHAIDAGVFESNKMTVAEIVNNDWLNYCDIIYKKDDEKLYNRLMEFVKNGQYDVSSEDWDGYNYSPEYIEAYNDDAVLIRI